MQEELTQLDPLFANRRRDDEAHDLKKKFETEADLAKQDRLAKHDALHKYMLNFLINSVTEKGAAPVIAGQLAMQIKGEFMNENHEFVGRNVHRTNLPDITEKYPNELSFVQDVVRLVNKAKHELVNRTSFQRKPNDDIDYGIILAEIKEKYGEVPG